MHLLSPKISAPFDKKQQRFCRPKKNAPAHKEPGRKLISDSEMIFCCFRFQIPYT